MRSIGILVALPDEGRTLFRHRLAFESLTLLPEGHWLSVSGAGPKAAEQHAHRLVDQGVEGLLSWGCAASLHESISPGTLLLPECIQDLDGAEQPVDAAWHRKVKRVLEPHQPLCTQNLTESPVVVASAKDKRALHQASGAYAVDMESAAVGRVATQRRIPFLVIRSVADSVHLDFPKALLDALNPRGDVQMGALLKGLTQKPQAIPSLLRLGRDFNAAMKTLKAARSCLGDDFKSLKTP